jgi:GxxExxY protein
MNAHKDEIEQIGRAIIDSALKVHSTLGPGLLEGAYELCLDYEVRKAGLDASRQVSIPICYDQLRVDSGYRIDLLVQGLVVVELKALEAVLPVHRYQVLSYLRLGGFRLGYLLNFNVAHMRDGITRLVNGL